MAARLTDMLRLAQEEPGAACACMCDVLRTASSEPPGIVGFIGLGAMLREADDCRRRLDEILEAGAWAREYIEECRRMHEAAHTALGALRGVGFIGLVGASSPPCRCQTGDCRCETPANVVRSPSAHHDT